MSVLHSATVDRNAVEPDNLAIHRFEDDGCPNFLDEIPVLDGVLIAHIAGTMQTNETPEERQPLSQMSSHPIPPLSTTGGSLTVGGQQEDEPNLTKSPYYRHFKTAWSELLGDMRALNHSLRQMHNIGCDTRLMLRRKRHLLRAIYLIQAADRELNQSIQPDRSPPSTIHN